MIGFFLQSAFPDGDDVPASTEEIIFVSQVPGFVALDLRRPEGAAGFREAEVAAVFMSVPEATVDEDDGAVFRQDEVGFAGKGFVFWPVYRESVAKVVQHRAQGEFRLGVPATDE